MPASNTPSQAAAPGEAASNKPMSMRGRKKHKCTVCGNIARSRCPFYSCKGCCVKAKNPCHIHVLKPSPTGDSLQGSAASTPPQLSVTPTIARHPYDTLRLRTVKPLGLITRKEAGFINSWRFQKLRTHTEGIIVAEDEAFDRYMQNALLLEEVFAVNHAESLEGISSEGRLLIQSSEHVDGGVDVAMLLAGLRMRLRSSSKRKEVQKQKLRRAIDRSLQKLHRGEQGDISENEDFYMSAIGARRELKRMKVQSIDGKERLRRMEVFNALVEKLKLAENQEDFDSCLKTYEDNFVNLKVFADRHEESYCRDMHNPTASGSQEAAMEHHRVSGVESRESAEASLGKSNTSVLNFNASHKARVDSYGVLKQWWKIDTAAVDPCGHAFDILPSNIETL